MKKNPFFALLAVLMMAMCGCSDDPTPVTPNDGPIDKPTPPVVDETIYLNLTSYTRNTNWRQGYEGLGCDRYYLGLCDGDISEYSGIFLPKQEDGYLFYCAFFGTPSTDTENPIIPEGTYSWTGDDEKKIGNLEKYSTFLVRNNNFEQEQVALSDVKVTVEGTKGAYRITYQCTTEEGEKIQAIYEGDIDLAIGSPILKPVEWMTENYDAEFIGASVVYRGSSMVLPGACQINVQLYDKEPVEGRQEEGLAVRLELVAPDVEGPNPMIPEGTYTLTIDNNFYTSPVGDVFNMGDMGGIQEMGTTARLYDESTQSYLYAAFLTGTIEVANVSETEQTITVNLATAEGVTVTGSYTGAITLDGYVYIEETEEPLSPLTEDTVMPKLNYSRASLYSNHPYIEGDTDTSLVRLWFCVENPDLADGYPVGAKFELTIPYTEEAIIPTGTYTIDMEKNYPAYSYTPGEYVRTADGNFANGSYGYVTYRWGFIKDVAPAIGGELQITHNEEDNTYSVSYEILDDRENTITGAFEGKINISLI